MARGSDAGAVSLTALAQYLNRYLQVGVVPDVPGIVNGLQHRNSGRVDCVVAAVDACLATIDAAARCGRALLMVHHGLPATATKRPSELERRRRLRQADVALFACHIPLDLHPVVGNNVLLARLLGLSRQRPFGRYGRRRIGIEGRLNVPVDVLISRLESLLGVSVYAVRGGAARASRIAVVTGNGTRWIDEAAALGIDTLVMGEAGHHDALYAEELGLNLVCAGHYATETLGVKATAAHLGARFGLPWGFVDHPTGL